MREYHKLHVGSAWKFREVYIFLIKFDNNRVEFGGYLHFMHGIWTFTEIGSGSVYGALRQYYSWESGKIGF